VVNEPKRQLSRLDAMKCFRNSRFVRCPFTLAIEISKDNIEKARITNLEEDKIQHVTAPSESREELEPVFGKQLDTSQSSLAHSQQPIHNEVGGPSMVRYNQRILAQRNIVTVRVELGATNV
jgi:hypothetical protein